MDKGEGSKRRRISSTKDKAGKAETKPKYSSWSWSLSNLPVQLLGLILGKLYLVDIIHCCAVCSSWRSTVQSHCTQSASTTPWLMLPGNVEDDSTIRCFFNLAENKVYKMKNAFEGFGEDAWCVGSSHGWLVILDDEAIPHLLNPFSRVRIQLPSIPNELLCPNIDRDYFVRYLRKIFIAKAVLLADPSVPTILGWWWSVVLSQGLHFVRKGTQRGPNLLSDLSTHTSNNMLNTVTLYAMIIKFTSWQVMLQWKSGIFGELFRPKSRALINLPLYKK